MYYIIYLWNAIIGWRIIGLSFPGFYTIFYARIKASGIIEWHILWGFDVVFKSGPGQSNVCASSDLARNEFTSTK